MKPANEQQHKKKKPKLFQTDEKDTVVCVTIERRTDERKKNGFWYPLLQIWTKGSVQGIIFQKREERKNDAACCVAAEADTALSGTLALWHSGSMNKGRRHSPTEKKNINQQHCSSCSKKQQIAHTLRPKRPWHGSMAAGIYWLCQTATKR